MKFLGRMWLKGDDILSDDRQAGILPDATSGSIMTDQTCDHYYSIALINVTHQMLVKFFCL